MSISIVYTTALAVMITCLPDCSLTIAGSGITLCDLDSRQIVRDRLGPPDSITEVDLIDPHSEEIRRFEVENYHIHAKFSNAMPMGAPPPPIWLLVEPLLTCSRLYAAAKEYVEGHHLEFVYDEQGNTIGHQYPQSFLEQKQAENRRFNVLKWEKPSLKSGR